MFNWIKAMFKPRPVDAETRGVELGQWRRDMIDQRRDLIERRARAVRHHRAVAGIDAELKAVMRQIMEVEL